MHLPAPSARPDVGAAGRRHVSTRPPQPQYGLLDARHPGLLTRWTSQVCHLLPSNRDGYNVAQARRCTRPKVGADLPVCASSGAYLPAQCSALHVVTIRNLEAPDRPTCNLLRHQLACLPRVRQRRRRPAARPTDTRRPQRAPAGLLPTRLGDRPAPPRQDATTDQRPTSRRTLPAGNDVNSDVVLYRPIVGLFSLRSAPVDRTRQRTHNDLTASCWTPADVPDSSFFCSSGQVLKHADVKEIESFEATLLGDSFGVPEAKADVIEFAQQFPTIGFDESEMKYQD
ncbi:unnamed protein product (mitochondrion) [Plasmodiophora brassicae]|uniref:Uncharacterized protein n=1 Tax=Plasmodiophora brassicae TaxID=37360 RepID=A0A3P3YP10_PLABS|nr:unnamed protein product [Plasmodiophora brassicae]